MDPQPEYTPRTLGARLALSIKEPLVEVSVKGCRVSQRRVCGYRRHRGRAIDPCLARRHLRHDAAEESAHRLCARARCCERGNTLMLGITKPC